MPIDIPPGISMSDEVLEALRVRAIRARELGFRCNDIADILGVAPESVSRWWSAYQSGGVEALPGDRSGRPFGSGRTLTAEQEEQIQQGIVEKSPEEHGIASALWTRQAVAELIEKEFGIKMPIRTVGEYLNRWGFTPQKPKRKSYKQDPEAVRRWLAEEYPEIERRAAVENAEIHWGDETGVRSTCQVGRGYAPRGETPELKVAGNRFSVNMISTITNQGKVRWMIYTGRMNAALFIVFLQRLLRGARQKLFLIVDRLSVHEAAAVDNWLADKKDRIEVFYLPTYSPELNPDEYLNCDVKAGVNAKGLPKTRENLKDNLKRFMHKLAQLPKRVASYFRHKCINYAADLASRRSAAFTPQDVMIGCET
jgi:transposase